MALADAFLDTSWTVQYAPGTRRRLNSLHDLFDSLNNHDEVSQQLRSLSEDCLEYLLSRNRAEPEDELNDRTEKTGQLRECAISPVQRLLPQNNTNSMQQASGLLIETRYQKTTYQVILLTAASAQRDRSPISLILFKGNVGFIKNIKNWLDLKFGLPSSSQLQLPPSLLLQVFSEYLVVLTSSLPQSADHLDALRQAMLKQVIGSFKMTVAFTDAEGSEVAPQLKTLDFDIPAETVNVLLDKAQKRNERGVSGFLDELTTAIHEKTGLKLPLRAGAATTLDKGDITSEPPMKVIKITCAAFAINVEGKIKFSSKPIKNAEVIGYESMVVRKANQQVLDILCREAGELSAGEG